MTALVIRTNQMPEVLNHLERMGLAFSPEKHGNGPDHYACEINGLVLEIYPTRADGVERVEFR